MAEIHDVRMTHKTCDKILDVLRDAQERGDEEAGRVADTLLEKFERDHRGETKKD